MALAVDLTAVKFPQKWQARRDSNPQHPDLESGALTVRATGLQTQSLFGFFMKRMCTAKWAMLLKLQLIRSSSLVL
jgi:hypothetical protein